MSFQDIIATPSFRMDLSKARKLHPALRTTRNWTYPRKVGGFGKLKNESSVPELDFDSHGACLGIKTQPTITNHAVRTFPTASQAFVDASATIGYIQLHGSTTVAFNAGIGLDGQNNAFKLRAGSGNVECGIGYRIGRVTQNTFICNSFYIKKVEGRFFQTRWWSGDIGISGAYANFDTETGQTANYGCEAVGMESAGDGWWRVWAITKVTESGVGSGPGPDIGMNVVGAIDAARRAPWNGAVNAGMLIWGIQISTVTSLAPPQFIITSGSAITVTGEFNYIEQFNKYLGNNQGTIALKTSRVAATLTVRTSDIVTLSAETYALASRLSLVTNGSNYYLRNNNDVNLITVPASEITGDLSIVISFNGTQVSLLLNGKYYSVNSGATSHNYARLHLGGNPTPGTMTPGGATGDMHVRSVLAFDRALTEREMKYVAL